jgi:hypothetical protein
VRDALWARQKAALALKCIAGLTMWNWNERFGGRPTNKGG